MHRLIRLFLILMPLQASAIDNCSEDIKPVVQVVPSAPAYWPESVDSAWVLTQFVVDEDGSVKDIKAVKYSSELFIRSAGKAAMGLHFSPQEKQCLGKMKFTYVAE
jgi:hypothetical protein